MSGEQSRLVAEGSGALRWVPPRHANSTHNNSYGKLCALEPLAIGSHSVLPPGAADAQKVFAELLSYLSHFARHVDAVAVYGPYRSGLSVAEDIASMKRT